jgi:hypothetical protein
MRIKAVVFETRVKYQNSSYVVIPRKTVSVMSTSLEVTDRIKRDIVATV